MKELTRHLPPGLALALSITGCAAGGGTGPAAPPAPAADAASPPAVSDGGWGSSPTPPTPDAGADVLADGSTPPPRPPECDARAEWIYVVDRERRLAQFRPESREFVEVGVLGCPESAGTPRSMSVDQHAVAHVLYGDGRIYTVSTEDGSCSPTGVAPSGADLTHFGMGFSADGPGHPNETLFVIGGNIVELLEEQAPLFATLEDGSRTVRSVSRIEDWGELSGNRNGDLYVFRPSREVFSRITPARIDRLDKTSGTPTAGWELTAMGTGDLRAWAFAYWGERFYVFVQTREAASSDVWRFTPDTGEVEQVLSNVGRGITGAGVSTCAPITLI